MKKERLELLLEELSRKLDLLLEMQAATLKMMQGYREESNVKHDHTAFLLTTVSKKVASMAADS